MTTHLRGKGSVIPALIEDAASAPDEAERQLRERRERIATATLQGLLASTPLASQPPSNADAMANRAVRYADALLEALNRATAEGAHARAR